ncbi:MAG: Lrp/AsnC ligand binding domain-containing protein [Phenylobacterium sp.]
MSIGVLRREMASLKAANLVRVVTVLNVSRLARTLECVTRLKVDWRADQAITAMERRLIDHPDVLNVALVAGAFDYVVESRHADKHAAAEFARALRADPAVTGLHIDHVRTRFRRLG